MKNRFIKGILCLALFFIFSVPAFAEDVEIGGEDIYNKTVEDVVSGKLSLNPVDIINRILADVYSEIANVKGTVKSILLVAVLAGILRVLSDAFEKNEASTAASFACFTLMSILAVKVFAEVVGYGAGVVHNICDFITKFEPIFVGLLVTGGAPVQAAAFQPVLVSSVYVLTVFVDKCILPMTYFSATIGIVNNMGSRIELGTLKKLIDSSSKWMLTGILTLFSAILSLYGFGTSAFSGMATKGIKFAVGSFVPVVGGILSDTVDTVLAGTNLLKNAVGTAGMIAIIVMASVPIIKIWIMMMLLKITAAFIEPFSDKKITGVLITVSDAIGTVFSMVITAGALFIISIGIILVSTGVSI